MNLKPFNLERALAGDPIVTRDRRKVIEFYYFKKANQDNLCFAYLIEGEDIPTILRKNGEHRLEDPRDLFMLTQTKKLWIAVRKKPCMSGYHEIAGAHEDRSTLRHYENDGISIIKEIEIEI